MTARGFLAIFSDVSPEAETDYLHWLTREHTTERLDTDDFLAVRVFRAMDVPARRYLIVYDLAGPDALASAAYLRKLDHPSAWSQRIMPMLGGFVRAGGVVAAHAGTGRGAMLAVLTFDDAGSLPDAQTVASLAAHDRIAAVRLLVTDVDRTTIRTREKAMRTGDHVVAGLLVIEGLDREALRQAVDALASRVRDSQAVRPPTPPAAYFESVFALDRA